MRFHDGASAALPRPVLCRAEGAAPVVPNQSRCIISWFEAAFGTLILQIKISSRRVFWVQEPWLGKVHNTSGFIQQALGDNPQPSCAFIYSFLLLGS